MNIIDYKINEAKLQELTDKAYERGLIDPFFLMNNETIAMLEAHCYEQYGCERILYKYTDFGTDTYYCGIEILLDNVPDFAEKVMCQHYIISYGDNRELIKNLCDILGIEVI